MTVYKRGIIVSSVLCIVSLIIAIVLNYGFEETFWCNVLLGVFGSSFLTMVTSVIGYRHERRIVLEEFYTETLKLINRFNKYQTDFSLDQKIDFYLDLEDYDTTDWDFSVGKMDFFNKDNWKYIYGEIYKPLLDTYNKACSHSWHFRMHKNGTGTNEAVMQTFIDEIEPCFIEKKTHTLQTEDGDIHPTSIKNKIVDDMLKELDGKYYELMYGKKKAQTIKEDQK